MCACVSNSLNASVLLHHLRPPRLRLAAVGPPLMSLPPLPLPAATPTNSVFVDVDELEIVVDLEQMTAHDIT